jgi:hypothetical protein
MATFSETQDLVPFMKAKGLSTVNIATNPATGKTFVISDGTITMRLSAKVSKIDKSLRVSWFAPEDGEPSWLLHPAGESPLEINDTFSI